MDWLRRIWGEIGVYKARHPLIKGMWFVGGKLFIATQPTKEDEFLASLELEGKVIYDIGANVGVMTLFFARSVGDGGVVVAFEPHPYSFHCLSRNIRVNRLRNIQVINTAVGEQKGHLELFQPSRHLSAATFDRVRAVQLREGELIVHTVEVDTLDALVRRFQLPPPNLIKVDVEGYENNVLLGATEIIMRFKPAWFIEVHRNAEGIATTKQVVTTLSAFGYRFFHVETQTEVYEDIADTIRGGHLFCTRIQEEAG